MKKKNITIIIGAFIAIIGIYAGVFLWLNPYMHDRTLNNFSDQLFSIQIPGEKDLLDKLSIVGQQSGNGDHCDYLAAIELGTNLSREDLEDYFRDSYRGDSEIQFIWFSDEGPYTTEGFDPLVIFTLKDWIEVKLESSPESVVVYIFEHSMTSSFDYRCS